MVWIDGPAINPNIALIAVHLQLFLTRAVTVLAQRLQLPPIEQLVVTMVGRDVVRHGGRGDHVPRQAHDAQGMFLELCLSSTLPTPCIVEVVMATGLL
jgi:hypothetical protein